MISAGQLCQINWPSPATAADQSRPALALETEDDTGNVSLLFISDRKNPADSLEIEARDYTQTALPKAAYIRLSQPALIRASRLIPLTVSVTPEFLTKVRKALILRDTRAFSQLAHRANRPAGDNSLAFIPGLTAVPYAARVFTEDEVEAAVSSTLDFWLTLGPQGEAFEAELAATMGVKHTLLVNSGSSANLIALTSLTTHKLPPHKRLQAGDEVITVAAGFPTTVAPIIQNGLVPVFIDNDPTTGNAKVDQLEQAFVAGKTKAVMMAHTLGNPFDLAAVLEFCRKHDLWLVEDNCDSLGSTYSLPLVQARRLGLDHLIKQAEAGTHPIIRLSSEQILTAPTGAFGDLSTQSFYPPHHLTMGEGGSVNIVSRPPLKTYAESFRDWGRDCWCPSGKDNTCNQRFGWQLGELPKGYDHKYIYSHLGYNLKPLDSQAAIGRQQLKKLPGFVAARIANWQRLRSGLADLGEFFDFTLPTHASRWTSAGFEWSGSNSSSPSWFGFMLRVRPSAPFSHTDLARHLDQHKIGNRMLFGGNLTRQPAFVRLKKDRPTAFRVASELTGADMLMHQALFLGTFPGLAPEAISYEIDTIQSFVRSF